jgi:hypothetical protein
MTKVGDIENHTNLYSWQIIPTSLEKLMEITIRKEMEGPGKRCQGCGKVDKDEETKMVRCKGCEEVWYCGKVCCYSFRTLAVVLHCLYMFDCDTWGGKVIRI